MKGKVLAALAVLSFSAISLNAQNLQTTTWNAYGVSFKAPQGFSIEDDSEEGYIISTPEYFITVQLLEGEGISKSEIIDELKNIATDDEVSNQTPVTRFELPQFYGAQLQGDCEGDSHCLYCYLLSKDDSCGFYVSILYTTKGDQLPEQILKSFKLEY
ncbi:hypothetical protein [uncultured Bacteroides sp.]|uniref:hypothetical protein n=1 Tax=uncultured Bacteroides sp. TaxID=162156 RepID=UPI002619E59D|nr:hypothetical protein [uncultured Bacteroides sp.]